MIGGRGRRRRGSTLLEFTLAVPFMLVLVFMAIDVGRIVIVTTALHESVTVAARAGARGGFVGANPAANGGTPCLPPAYPDNVAYNAFCDGATQIPGATIRAVKISSPTTNTARGLVCENGPTPANLYVTISATADVSLTLPGLAPLVGALNPSDMTGQIYATGTARCEVARR